MGIFDSLFQKIYEYFNPNWDFNIETSLNKFKEYLNNQQQNPVIRMYVAPTKGSGHQGSTVGILRQLTTDFAYSGTIEVYYDNDGEALKKLQRQLPELQGGTEGKVNGAAVKLVQQKDQPPAQEVNLGFTGGADDKDTPKGRVTPNFAKIINTKYFLRLQPFKWYNGANQIQFNTERKFITLTEVDVLGYKTFAQRAYYLHLPVTVTKEEWQYFLKDNEKPTQVVQWITEQKDFDFAVVYGINNQSPMAFAYEAEDRMFLAILTMLAAQRNQKGITPEAKPIILLSLGNFRDKDGKLKDLIEGGEANNDGWLEEKAKIAMQKDRKQYLEKVKAKDRVHYVWDASLENIKAELKWLAGPKDRLLFVQLGGVPKPLYNLLLQETTLPPIFEGQGTANDVLNMGKYYIQPATEGRLTYPSTIIGYPEYARADIPPVTVYLPAIPLNIQEIANNINFYTYEWPADEEETPSEIMGNFIKDYREDEEGTLRQYFVKVAKFYQKPNNDKFRWAVSYLNYIVAKSAQAVNDVLSLDAAGDLPDSVLGTLLVNLRNNQSAEQVLRLMPGAMNSGPIYDFYNGLLQKDMVINKSIISPTPATGDPTSIKVTGNTDILGVPLAAEITYTAPEDVIISNTRFIYHEKWAPAELPWFIFSDPFVQFQIIDANTLTSGSVGGRIDSADIELSIKLPIIDGKWQLMGNFEEPLSINRLYQIAGGVNLMQALPAPFNTLAGFGVSNLQLVYDSNDNTIEYLGFLCSTTEPYKLMTGVTMESTNAGVTIQNPGSVAKRSTSWSVSGIFAIGTGDDAGIVTLGVLGPDITLSGQLQSGTIAVVDLFNIFLAGVGFKLPASSPLPVISEFQFSYDLAHNQYSVTCSLNTHWDIDILGTTIFTVEQLGVSVAGQNSNLLGGLNGLVTILPDDPNVNLQLSLNAAYNTANKVWHFSGKQTQGRLSISGLLKEYLKWDTDLKIDIDGLGIDIMTSGTDGSAQSWQFTAKTADAWSIPIPVSNPARIFGDVILGYGAAPKLDSIESGMPLELDNTDEKGLYGTIHTRIQWNNIDLIVFYDFHPDFKSFGIKWGVLEGKIETNGETKAILKFTESTTIGSMVETMVSWATGSAFSLGSPWNILDSIPLNNLALEYNFTKKQVGFTIDIGPIEMGFAKITGLKITYQSNQPKAEDNGVMVEIAGEFRWQDNPGNPLKWDAAKPETTPAPQGQGNKYLDLRFLALGQHVTLPGFTGATTVPEAIECMEKLPQPDQDNIVIPPVTLDANSSWIIGMDFGILRFGSDNKTNGPDEDTGLMLMPPNEPAPSGYFIAMQIVFNDPYLYALRIKLDGEAAKVLKGLDFQIMYKKISDTLGLFKAEIALPEQMRFISMEEFDITLPVFGIEYYTNGDFQVDFGFPWKADFSRSFTFQALIWTPAGIPIPVMGSLGVYFGKLSGATTSKVPAITNGTFNPVLVFGFGIQFGLGYTFEMGILKAGFSLTAVAIVEGVVAKFNPYAPTEGSGGQDQINTTYYFWLKGTTGIIGKLFGSIDFAIIKADVDIDIRILGSFVFSPYQPIELDLCASVDVSVSVKINCGLFKIKISFSFSAKISQSVTIKATDGNPPWQIAGTQANALMLLPRRGRRRSLLHQLRLMNSIEDVTPNWNNLIAAAIPQPIRGYMALGLTVAGDAAINPSDQLACYVAMMFIDSVKAPQADNTDCIDKAFSSGTDTSFEILAKMILRWAIAAVQPEPVNSDQVDQVVVTDFMLKKMMEALNDPAIPTPISGADIENFMGNQFKFSVEGPTTAKEPDAAYFPVAPSVILDVPKYGDDYVGLNYSFAEYNRTSSDYREYLRHYFDALALQVQQEKQAALKSFALADTDGDSLASFIFADYFLMICRQMIQAALDSLREFKYYLKDNDTPEVIVEWVNEGLGYGTDTGFDEDDNVNYSVEELFFDNAGAGLMAGKSLVIHGAVYVVQVHDTFDSIAANPLFGGSCDGASVAMLNAGIANTLNADVIINYPGREAYTTRPGDSLAAVAEQIGVSITDLIKNAGITSLGNLPLPVATYKIPDFKYLTTAGDTLRSIAARFRIGLKDLAAPAEHGKIENLFDKSVVGTLDIANLNRFEVGKLIQEIQATQGLQHLSGMVSRYYMAGLRLPTKGVTPLKKGMWVSGSSPDEYKLPDFAGLYALTGQQFIIPKLNGKEDFKVNLTNGGSQWLTFVNSDPARLSVTIKPDSADARQLDLVKGYATSNILDTGITYLGLRSMFLTEKATYSLTNNISWNAATAFNMPYGGLPSGIPSMQLWRLPDLLLALPDRSSRQIDPRMAMKVGEYNEAMRAMVASDLTCYGYSSLLEFTVKKVPLIKESPATLTTYEVMGADAGSVKVLERIVCEIGDKRDAIQTLIVAYETNPNSTTSSGIQTDAPQSLTIGLAQVNLSTETRPDTGDRLNNYYTDNADSGMVLLNSTTDFIRLLWEAGITRDGGYYLYYYNKDSQCGLPDRIFNDKAEARLSLIVVYSDMTDHTVCSYMNALVTGENIDPKHSTLYAEASPIENLYIPSSATQSLAGLAYGYFGNVSQLVNDNAGLSLRSGLNLSIAEGTYEVGPGTPGGSLANIADHFGTTVEAIKQANPKINAWPDPLKLYTALYLPELKVLVGTGKGGTTLGDLAWYYGVNITALGHYNQDVPGIFADGQNIKISGGPVLTSSAVPPGNVTIEVTRPQPPEVADQPAGSDYGKTFMLNLYSMLSPQIAENSYFEASDMGLPAGPVSQPDIKDNYSKVRIPGDVTEGEEWLYRLSIPYSRFSLPTRQNMADLPDPMLSPYKGIGDLLQIDFAWQDLYGNRCLTDLNTSVNKVSGVLNQPPLMTGYNDPVIGLKQWPSVAATYEVVKPTGGNPAINAVLTFDSSAYRGLLSVAWTADNKINAVFTDALDCPSAETTGHYSLDQGFQITGATLGSDQRTVTLTTGMIPEPEEWLTLRVDNVSAFDKSLTFHGAAKFAHSTNTGTANSTLVQKAQGDLQTYTRLWYQLTDPCGIAYTVESSLVTEKYILNDTQSAGLVQGWLAGIWRFINDRAQGNTTVPLPDSSHILTFEIDPNKLNRQEIYKLELQFTIERTGGAVLGDLETTSGISYCTAAISPFVGAAGKVSSGITAFITNFEQALVKEGVYQLKIVSGVDRDDSLSGNTDNNELWVVRLGLNDITALSYRIDNPGAPAIFAPRPISTKLENRNSVPIWDFDPATGIDFSSTPHYLNFTGVDLDVWAQQLVNSMDDILSPEFVTAIQLVDHRFSTTHLEKLLNNKKALADIMKDWLTSVFEDGPQATAELREAFRQQLLVKLGNAYDVKAALQYNACVAAGEFKLFFAEANPADSCNVKLYFTSDVDRKAAEDIGKYSVSDGRTVVSAALDTDSAQCVMLRLNDKAIIEKTQVTISSDYKDVRGNLITGSRSVQVVFGSAATPRLYGNIIRNFRFVGVVVDREQPAKIHLHFGEIPDQTCAEDTKNYQISGGLGIVSAQLDDDNPVVELVLAGSAVPDQTTVSLSADFVDSGGHNLMPPFTRTVKNSMDNILLANGISITAAKLNCKNSDAVPLSFLISAPQLVQDATGAVLPYIDLDTSFTGSFIEHQISSLPGVKDYHASSWLNFFSKPGILTADLGSARVPMILRSFPASPSMTGQQGQASQTISVMNIDHILDWDYTIAYSQAVHYPQDELYFTVNFNVADGAENFASIQDAFNDLAEFVTVVPDIQKVFQEILIKIDAATSDMDLFNAAAMALKSFNDVVARIVKAAEGNTMVMASRQLERISNCAEPYCFRLKEGVGSGERKSALVITIIGQPPEGIGEPRVEIPNYKTVRNDNNDGFSFYFIDSQGEPLSAEEGQKIGPRKVVLPEMNILARQDVETIVELKRNVDLVSGKIIADDFVYSTGKVGFSNPYHPLIEYDQAFSISKLGGDRPDKLRNHLRNLFAALLKENSQDTLSFQMTNTYTYPSNNNLDALELPVMMQPLESFSVKLPSGPNGDKTLDDMLDGWSGSILKWFKTHQPVTANGVLHFDLTIFSNLTQQPMPLLRLHALLLETQYIDDLSQGYRQT
ncbi:MAG: LysM peptidoglycan-binding domain-containing protein [Syntrophomonas sp.]